MFFYIWSSLLFMRFFIVRYFICFYKTIAFVDYKVPYEQNGGVWHTPLHPFRASHEIKRLFLLHKWRF